MKYTVAYDIADDRRRLRIAKFLEAWGRRVQESVFECNLSADELQSVYDRLKELVNTERDRCHIYRLCGECAPKRLVLGAELELEPKGALVV